MRLMPHPDLSPTEPASHLDELDALQDEVLAQLDQLNHRIESMLREHGAAGSEGPAAAA